jgi:putative transposase
VSKRVSPTDRLRAEADELFGSGRELAAILEDVARLSVRLMMQTALEAEVDAFPGRARYQRRDPQGSGRLAERLAATNHRACHDGRRPAATPEAARHRSGVLLPTVRRRVTRTNALESLVISGWVRGLSDRDVEATLAEVLGPEAALSKSTVSRICQRIRDEFAAWRSRDLSSIRLDYLFLDASHFKMHPGAPAEPVLAAWASTPTASPCSSGWVRRGRNQPMPGTTSSPAWWAAGCTHRCSGSVTARPG